MEENVRVVDVREGYGRESCGRKIIVGERKWWVKTVEGESELRMRKSQQEEKTRKKGISNEV